MERWEVGREHRVRSNSPGTFVAPTRFASEALSITRAVPGCSALSWATLSLLLFLNLHHICTQGFLEGAIRECLYVFLIDRPEALALIPDAGDLPKDDHSA